MPKLNIVNIDNSIFQNGLIQFFPILTDLNNPTNLTFFHFFNPVTPDVAILQHTSIFVFY